MEHKWQELSENILLPDHIVNANDSYDYAKAILVGRAYLDDEPMPATVLPILKCAYVSKNGREYVANKYEVLVGKHYYWQACEGGYFPENAVDFGTDKQLFIGRVHHEETVRVGRVDASQGVICFPYNGHEVCLKSYDVLAFDNTTRWVSASYKNVPSNAIVGGKDYGGRTIYIGRSSVKGQWLPTNIIPSAEEVHARLTFYETPVIDYQFLCGTNYTWQKVYNQYIPPNTVTTGTTSRGDPWHVARGKNHGDQWHVTHGYIQPGLLLFDKRFIHFRHYYQKSNEYEVLVEDL